MLRSLGTLTVVAALWSPGAARGSWASQDDWSTLCELRSGNRYEATTRRCIACHDGSVARGIEAGAARHGAVMGPSHPVEVDYDGAVLRQRTKLRPRAGLPRGLWLPGGKMTCVTCHDGRAPTAGRLAVSSSRSELCFACHDV